MLRRVDQLLSAQPPASLALFSLLLVAVIGAADYLTGNELSFSVFYLIPVTLGSWYLRGRFGLLVCILSATTWLVVDYISGNLHMHPVILFWNTGVRFGFFLVVAILLQRLRSALEMQASLAQLDELTGLLNVRAFKQRCSAIFELAARNQRTLALAYIDLDNFKVVNDSLGHSVGDQVLKAVADAFAKRLRKTDICARLGGDEFSVLLPETDLSGSRSLFAGLHTYLLEIADLNHWPVGFSIGVAVFHSPQANTIDAAIQTADALMYRVKQSGKNRILLEEFGDLSSSDQSVNQNESDSCIQTVR